MKIKKHKITHTACGQSSLLPKCAMSAMNTMQTPYLCVLMEMISKHPRHHQIQPKTLKTHNQQTIDNKLR